MKKIISIILSLIIISGVCVTAGAENIPYPEMTVNTHGYKDGIFYIFGEEIIINPTISDIGLEEIYKGVIVYLDCNKEVLEYIGTPLGTTENMVRYSETDTGYMAEIIWGNPAAIPLYAAFTMKIAGKDNPDVSIKAYKVVQNNSLEEMNITFDLPENKVYEKEEIPQIVAKPQPPVFGEMHARFSDTDVLYLFEPVTVDKIFNMLSVSADGGEIKYVSRYGEDNKYPVTNDMFVLEFAGKICDVLHIRVIGDANNDGTVTAADARLILRQSAKLDTDSQVCDVTNDGKTTAADARMILRVSAQLDYFRLPDITVWQNQPYQVGPLESASDGGYMWRCTVSEENAIEITEKTESSVDNTGKPPLEILLGAPELQTFILRPLKQGEFEVKFELIRPWETTPIKEFGFTIVVDDIL